MDDEAQQLRRENHRAIERRRRDRINTGIEDLSKIVPGCQKSKGKVITKTVDYLQQILKTNSELTSSKFSFFFFWKKPWFIFFFFPNKSNFFSFFSFFFRFRERKNESQQV